MKIHRYCFWLLSRGTWLALSDVLFDICTCVIWVPFHSNIKLTRASQLIWVKSRFFRSTHVHMSNGNWILFPWRHPEVCPLHNLERTHFQRNILSHLSMFILTNFSSNTVFCRPHLKRLRIARNVPKFFWNTSWVTFTTALRMAMGN